MITRIPPNGFLQARYVFTKSPDLENNKLYNRRDMQDKMQSTTTNHARNNTGNNITIRTTASAQSRIITPIWLVHDTHN